MTLEIWHKVRKIYQQKLQQQKNNTRKIGIEETKHEKKQQKINKANPIKKIMNTYKMKNKGKTGGHNKNID